MNDSDVCAGLARGFRERFLDHDELEDQLNVWAQAFPEIVRLSSIGKTREGRELWLLTLGPEPDRLRPAVWVDANMHATELCGSSAALAIAEDVIRLHIGDSPALHGLPAHVIEQLREVLFYILPRMTPDGAEAVLKTGRFVRSVPRDARPDRNQSRWIAQDVNGDGLALTMRQQDPAGEFTESEQARGLMVPRELEDRGPFYKLYSEGMIENFDGITIPSPGFLADNPTDLNRNFPFAWMPAYEQEGAGEFPLSETESRSVVEFTSRAPHLFAWLNFHTFGGVFIRPLGDKPDNEMDPEDLALFRQLEAWADAYTDYPTVSGFEEFTYKPNKALHGDLTDYAYHQRGCIAYVCELWDLFQQVGVERKRRFVDYYTHLTREELVAIARWDAAENHGRVLKSWQPFDHPQLGPVEIGGLDPRFGIWNPPAEKIAEICVAQSATFLRVAAMAPRIVVTAKTHRLGGGLTRIDVTVANQGYLPTYILSSARRLDWNEPLFAEITTTACQLEDPKQSRREVGHLDGWGRGLFDGNTALAYQRSRGNTNVRTLSWLVNGAGEVNIRVGSCRVGWTLVTVEVSEAG